MRHNNDTNTGYKNLKILRLLEEFVVLMTNRKSKNVPLCSLKMSKIQDAEQLCKELTPEERSVFLFLSAVFSLLIRFTATPNMKVTNAKAAELWGTSASGHHLHRPCQTEDTGGQGRGRWTDVSGVQMETPHLCTLTFCACVCDLF